MRKFYTKLIIKLEKTIQRMAGHCDGSGERPGHCN